MKKSEIVKLRIDILSGNDSALSLMIGQDGTLGRQGNGTLPADKRTFFGTGDGSVFSKLINMLDEGVFQHAAVYDHPDKSGSPITWSVAFLDKHGSTLVFEFRFGSKTRDTGELLPYFDGFITQAIGLTDNWHAQEKSMIAAAAN